MCTKLYYIDLSVMRLRQYLEISDIHFFYAR